MAAKIRGSAMKSIQHNAGTLHVEAPLGIINIRTGLTDAQGRRVLAVELIPDRIGSAPIHVLPDGRMIEDTPGCAPLEQFPSIRDLREEGQRVWTDTATGEQISTWRGRFFAYDRGAPAGKEVRELAPMAGCKRGNACAT